MTEADAVADNLLDFPALHRDDQRAMPLDRSEPASSSPPARDYLRRLVAALGFQPDTDHRCVMVAHLFDDTMRMLDAVAPFTQWDAIIGVPYSSARPGVEARWQQRFGERMWFPADLAALETVLASVLSHSLALCARNGQRLIVQDVGGFAAPLLQTYFSDRLHLVKGVVEITKQGVWRAADLPLGFPVLHCADSQLKRLEAVRCGETVVRCLDGVARSLGHSLAGRAALVMGAGWIGAGVARGLRRLDMPTSVVDPDPVAVLAARLDGYPAALRPAGLGRVELIVGATGRRSIDAEMLAALPDRAMVASASSRQIEIDVDWLHQFDATPVAAGITAYQVSAGRRLLLVNDGFPANFLPGSQSVADEIVEPILGELIVLQQALMQRDFPPGLHRIAPGDEALCARLWLTMRDEPLSAA
jgi:S-adenosylhomocysteine hydrolase